jgi:hypothetical protein
LQQNVVRSGSKELDENEEAVMEQLACTPVSVDPQGFNSKVVLPYGCTIDHIQKSMEEFVSFLGFINGQLYTKGIARLESMLMPANFSSIVGEFINSNLPKHCPTLVKNQYHNGHPDLIPKDFFPGNAVQHAEEGIEIKGSRYTKGWQGHNPENAWLMVFVFDSNRPVDASRGIKPKPFRFIKVVGARLSQDDWKFSGRKVGSRRTITATVMPSGYNKMMANWIYIAPGYEGYEGIGEPPEEIQLELGI